MTFLSVSLSLSLSLPSSSLSPCNLFFPHRCCKVLWWCDLIWAMPFNSGKSPWMTLLVTSSSPFFSVLSLGNSLLFGWNRSLLVCRGPLIFLSTLFYFPSLYFALLSKSFPQLIFQPLCWVIHLYYHIFNFQKLCFVLWLLFLFKSILFLFHGCNTFSYTSFSRTTVIILLFSFLLPLIISSVSPFVLCSASLSH